MISLDFLGNLGSIKTSPQSYVQAYADGQAQAHRALTHVLGRSETHSQIGAHPTYEAPKDLVSRSEKSDRSVGTIYGVAQCLENRRLANSV